MALQLLVEGRTDKGLVRPNNEDNFYLNESTGLLVVADGMGGHASGEVASKMAVDVIRDYFKNVQEGQAPIVGQYREDCSEITNQIGSAIRLANMAIYEAAKSDPKLKGMGTTIAAVLHNGNRLSIAHVGDSRIYLVRAGDIEQLTDDHSFVSEQVKRELITKEEAQKSDMKNILTRAVGIAPDVEIDFDELTLADRDILILCSDGLSSMVSDDDILSAATSVNNPVEACEKLIDMANKNGGRDNITVIAGYIRKKKSWLSLLFNFREWFRR
jgi:serine/threonine protein phosphatase PrpC